MLCPKCESSMYYVKASRSSYDEVIRLRICPVCGYKSYTSEKEIDNSLGNEKYNKYYKMYY